MTNLKQDAAFDPDHCMNCGAVLTFNDVGAHKKFINRGATSFFCQKCLCEKLNIEHALLLKKIEFFKAQGCTLFV
ncbi:MAG: hypothetical protein IJ390_12680 [Lachnospiraceae bacterium]|nr:hypothetical protein [Lachnospiraceae bacterium]